MALKFITIVFLIFMTSACNVKLVSLETEGATRVLLSKISQPEDTSSKLCVIQGKSFDGLADHFKAKKERKATENSIKLLVVHGIGEHNSGYSNDLVNGLAARLNLLGSSGQDSVQIRLTPPNPSLSVVTDHAVLNISRRFEISPAVD